jgi:hypothetical protein
MMEHNLREPGVSAQEGSGPGHRNGAAIATHPGQPEGMHLLQRPEPASRRAFGKWRNKVFLKYPRRQAKITEVCGIPVSVYRTEQVE